MSPYGYHYDFHADYISEAFAHERTKRQLETANETIRLQAARLLDQRQKIAALQQSLDAAEVGGLFAVELCNPIKVGHRVRSNLTGREYTVISVDGADVMLDTFRGWWDYRRFTKVY